MDFSVIFSGYFTPFWYFVPFFMFITVIKSAWFKGLFGEFRINFLLKRCLAKDQYTLIKDITLPTEDGTTQIDHIVVSQFGVFVLETKNMKGCISGTAKQKNWTQKIFKYLGEFQNPLHQNYKHTQTLAACLNVPTNCLYSVVVFIGNSTFKNKMPENVTYARGCVNYIKTKKEILFTAEQVDEMVFTIEAGRLSRSLQTNLQHNKHVKEIIATKQASAQTKTPATKKVRQKPSEAFCSKCGSELVLRMAKKGKNLGNQFWGCSSFPKCRTVVNVS